MIYPGRRNQEVEVEVEGRNFDAGFKQCEEAHLNPFLENVEEVISLLEMGFPETAQTLLEEAFKRADFRGGYKHD